MTDPLLFYRQIELINRQILATLEAGPDSLEAALVHLQERHAWMRDDNTPSPQDEAAHRSELLPLMETILNQDGRIAELLAGRQDALATELRSMHQTRVSQGYQSRVNRPDARFLDQAG